MPTCPITAPRGRRIRVVGLRAEPELLADYHTAPAGPNAASSGSAPPVSAVALHPWSRSSPLLLAVGLRALSSDHKLCPPLNVAATTADTLGAGSAAGRAVRRDSVRLE